MDKREVLDDVNRTCGEPHRLSLGEPPAVSVGASATDDDAIEDLELDDPSIDEAELPRLDMDDPEALGHEADYTDLLEPGLLGSDSRSRGLLDGDSVNGDSVDGRLLERSADAGDDDEAAVLEDIGLTINLDGRAGEEEGARVVDLDFGTLLTPLSSEASELELDSFGHERDGALGIGVLRDMLLPDSDEDALEDEALPDDGRFPAFDDVSDIAPRPSLDDDDVNRDELS